jgi:site-specific DNA recombinase
MLTIGYCRVSTEEQAAEGFSIEGQGEKLRMYAELRGLGSVTIVDDPGKSGKNLDRPGLQRILAAIEQGHVADVMVWRLDRLSRNLGDLIVLAELCLKRNVGLHSVTENLDLSTATGRMYFNIIGTFAQFYREQLGENVKMGMQQAVREGKWVNRPKTGYNLVAGELIANDDAAAVRQIFRLRAQGMSHREISEQTGIKHGTVTVILQSRVYLGEVQLNGEWFPGKHEPIITEAEFEAAHRGFTRGKRRGRDLLSGHVRCGVCSRAMSITQNGQNNRQYKCAHRGSGCRVPLRSNKGLLRAALLGLELLASDESLQDAIRRQLEGARRQARQGRSRAPRVAPDALAALTERRRKLLELHYADQISAELFGTEEAAIARQIEQARAEACDDEQAATEQDELARRFEEVLGVLADLDLRRVWTEASDAERRVLVDELLDRIIVFPDHLEVVVHGVPKVNVLLSEVGLAESQNARVGGGT